MDRMGKADSHVHTHYSGFTNLRVLRFPESVTSPEKQVDCARKHGLDVLCITDHNQVEGGFVAERYAKQFDDIEVIVGDEIMTSDGEIIGLGLTEYIEPFLTIEETVDIIREQGALTIAPHPFSFHVQGLKEKIFDIDLDGFEVINGGHPDAYANSFAQRVFDRYPDKWAAISASDAHSNFTMGYNWTEFEGRTADDFRDAIKKKKTVPKGAAAPVLGEVQWSYEVVLGGQKLMLKALRGKLENVEKTTLVDKIMKTSDLKKATGILAGMIYITPPIPFIATFLSTAYLKMGAKRMNRDAEDRLAEIDRIISGREETISKISENVKKTGGPQDA